MLHVGHLAVEMDNDKGFGVWGDSLFELFNIDKGGIWGDITESDFSLHVGDTFGGGDEGVGYRDDFVMWLYVCGEKGEMDGGGATGAAHAVFGVAEMGEIVFEFFDIRAHNEGGVVNDLLDGGIDFRFDGLVVGFEVNKGYFHGYYSG